MTTFTLTVDSRTAATIQHLAQRENRDESAMAAHLLQWAAAQQMEPSAQQMEPSAQQTAEQPDERNAMPDSLLSQAARQVQIRALFERNEW